MTVRENNGVYSRFEECHKLIIIYTFYKAGFNNLKG